MTSLNTLFKHTLLHHLCQEFHVRYRFKYVLPKVTRVVQDNIVLDLSDLSLKVRNRIQMGIYESHEKQLCQELLCPDDALLELGGAIGFIGLYCQKNLGIRRYCVVEANPRTLQILRRNYELNGLRPADAWHLALGSTDGMLDLDVGTDFWENSIVGLNGAKLTAATVRVPSATLGSILARIERKVNVLIIDIEWAEQFIDLNEIPEAVTKIVMEIHSGALGPERTYDLIAGLIHRGFYVAREVEGTFAFLRRPCTQLRNPPSRSSKPAMISSTLAEAIPERR
jgi:FkbM family methyltransferase